MNITSQESMEEDVIYIEMPMFFFASNYCIWIIKSWVTNTTGYFFLGLILTFIFSFIGEGVNFLHQKYYPSVYSEECVCNEQSTEQGLVKPKRKENQKYRIIKTAFTFVYYWWGIIDMILLMTYNVYVIIALSLGISFGHFVFINPKPVKNKECSCDCCKK